MRFHRPYFPCLHYDIENLQEAFQILLWKSTQSITTNLRNEERQSSPEAIQNRSESQRGFWSCPRMIYIYMVAFVALVSTRAWILQGVSLIVLEKTMEIVLKWILYILDDKELRIVRKFIRGYLVLFLREGEKVLSGEDAWRFAITFTALSTVPTGVSYMRFVVRSKMQILRQDFLDELGQNRWDRGSLLKSNLMAGIAKAQATGRKIKSSLHSQQSRDDY